MVVDAKLINYYITAQMQPSVTGSDLFEAEIGVSHNNGC